MAMQYGSFCPLSKAAEVISGRWTILILNELLLGGMRFSEIQQGMPLIPRSLLATRLKELEHGGILERVPQPGVRGYIYQLTAAGEALRPMVAQLAVWGWEWRTPYIDKKDRNVCVLMWLLRRQLIARAAPTKSYIFHFAFSNVPKRDHKMRQWWLAVRGTKVELCSTDMGFVPDMTVRADLEIFTSMAMGCTSLQQARQSGDIIFTGKADAITQFIDWLEISEPPKPRGAGYLMPNQPEIKMKSRAA